MELNWIIALVFGLSGLACFAGAYRGSRLSQPDAEFGLRLLLTTVGLWSVLQALQMLATSYDVAVALLTVGLIVGFGTVWAWLYFCSAYTGRTYHRDLRFQLLVVGIYLVLTTVKLTNFIHGQYFTAEFVTEPYPRLVIDQQPLYWISFTLAYVLTGVGLYFLLEMFHRSSHPTRALSALTLVTGLSIVPKVVSGLHPELLPELSYEPLGVAVFALGALYMVEDTFLHLEAPARKQFIEEADEAIITIDANDRIRDFNDRAVELVPGLGTSIMTADDLRGILPIEDLEETTRIATIDHPDGKRYYLVTDRSLRIGPHELGSALLIRDVTLSEKQRRELDRHNQQLEEMAGAIAHELRNSVAIVRGYLSEAMDRIDGDTPADAELPVSTAFDTAEQMEETIDQLHALTQYAQSVDRFDAVDFRAVVREAYDTTACPATLQIEGAGRIMADPTRLQQLFENAFKFASYNDASQITITLQEEEISIADDGTHASSEHGETLFEYEAAAPTAAAGMLLPNVETLARVHGWGVAVDTTYTTGVRYRIAGVDVTDLSPSPSLNRND